MNDMSLEANRLDRIAERYDSQTDFDHHLCEFGARLILEDFPGARLLEVGCASGVMSRQFVDHVEELHVLDGSQKYISALRSDLKDRATYHCCLAEQFTTDEPFDGIVMASLLEHVASPIGLLKRVSGWLHPDGVLYVIVPNANSLHRQIGVELGLLPSTTSFTERDRQMGHRRVYDQSLLLQHLAQASFSVRDCRGIMIKSLSNAQMESCPDATIQALCAVGLPWPQIAAEIYAKCVQSPPTDGGRQ